MKSQADQPGARTSVEWQERIAQIKAICEQAGITSSTPLMSVSVQTLRDLLADLEAARTSPPAAAVPDVLDRWNYSGLPSVETFDHAVDVANANFQRAEQAEARIAELDLKWAAASEFIRDVFEALGKPQPAFQATVDLSDLALQVIGQLEEQKARVAELETRIQNGGTSVAESAALLEICQRIEASSTPSDETHRERAIRRQRLIEAVYAIAETALMGASQVASPPAPSPATPDDRDDQPKS